MFEGFQVVFNRASKMPRKAVSRTAVRMIIAVFQLGAKMKVNCPGHAWCPGGNYAGGNRQGGKCYRRICASLVISSFV